jgi:hypothetical protein
VARNLLEEKFQRKHADHSRKTHAVMTNRVLMPRKLCYIDVDPTENNPDGIKVTEIDQGTCEPYLFIAYTTEQFPDGSPAHKEQLVRMATKATREQGLGAFWISCCCMDLDSVRTIEGDRILQNDVSMSLLYPQVPMLNITRCIVLATLSEGPKPWQSWLARPQKSTIQQMTKPT